MPIDPAPSHNFLVLVGLGLFVNPISLGFSRISGIGGSVNVIEVKECTDLEKSSRFPGRVTHNPVQFSRGVDENGFLLTWWNMVATDTSGTGPPPAYKFDVVIFPLADQGTVRNLGIRLRNAWPSALRMGAFDATRSGFLIQTLEVQHDGIVFGSA